MLKILLGNSGTKDGVQTQLNPNFHFSNCQWVGNLCFRQLTVNQLPAGGGGGGCAKGGEGGLAASELLTATNLLNLLILKDINPVY